MSGHSKWHQIKHKKAVTDSKRSQLFGRLARDVTIAARSGNDPATNAALRDTIARAKKANMPQANIDRLLAGAAAHQVAVATYEAFGPGGVSLLIVTATVNPNRSVAQLRAILTDAHGSLGMPGSARWRFTPVVRLTIPLAAIGDREALELKLIDTGALHFFEDETLLHIDVPLAAPQVSEAAIRHHSETAPTSTIVYTAAPENMITLAPARRGQLRELVHTLEAHEDVTAVYTNLAP